MIWIQTCRNELQTNLSYLFFFGNTQNFIFHFAKTKFFLKFFNNYLHLTKFFL